MDCCINRSQPEIAFYGLVALLDSIQLSFSINTFNMDDLSHLSDVLMTRVKNCD